MARIPTDLPINRENVAEIAACGGARSNRCGTTG